MKKKRVHTSYQVAVLPCLLRVRWNKTPRNVTAAVGELVRRSRHPTLHNVASCSFPNLKISENIQFPSMGRLVVIQRVEVSYHIANNAKKTDLVQLWEHSPAFFGKEFISKVRENVHFTESTGGSLPAKAGSQGLDLHSMNLTAKTTENSCAKKNGYFHLGWMFFFSRANCATKIVVSLEETELDMWPWKGFTM